MPVSCQQQFIPGSNIPIFSHQFLQHNRGMYTYRVYMTDDPLPMHNILRFVVSFA